MTASACLRGWCAFASPFALAFAVSCAAPQVDALPPAAPEIAPDSHTTTAAAATLRRAPEPAAESALLAAIDSLVMAALAEGAAPGAALAIGRDGRLLRLRGYGRLDTRAGFGAVTDSTIYDLASLTKVVATTTAIMLLVDDGRLDLDAPVASLIPEWPATGDKARITVAQLLTHSSGLPAFLPLWRDTRGIDAYVRTIAAAPLTYEPGAKTVYSDLGFMLAGRIVENVAGESLDALLQRRVFGPLGMRDTGFNPVTPECADGTVAPADVALLARIAPTEVDTLFRDVHVHGIVHDENACAAGGVAGHAGLFSSARDLAVFAQMLLNGGTYAGVRIVRAETLEKFSAAARAPCTCALGWAKPASGPGSHASSGSGAVFSGTAFGHTGFTGTSLWIDPARGLFVVLLTNRVNPTRDNSRHVALRRELHELVATKLAGVR